MCMSVLMLVYWLRAWLLVRLLYDYHPPLSMEKDLCPICKDGMKCASLAFHARHWNVSD
jgi:hypothetical protein